MSSYPPQQPPQQPPGGYPSPGGYPPSGQPGMPPQPSGQPGQYGQPPPQYGQPGQYSQPPQYAAPGQAVPPYGQYPAPPPGQPGYQWGGGAPAYPFATFGQRLGALLIDVLVLLAIIAIPYGIAFALLSSSIKTTQTRTGTVTTTNGATLTLAVILFIIVGVLSLLYEPLQTARKNDKNGQTVGRRALKIRITNLQGGPITTGQAWGRFLFRAFFSGSIFYLGYLWVLWDPMKQGWHDKVANTLVLRA